MLESLAEHYPGAIEDAVEAVPRGARKHFGKAVQALAKHLPASAAEAWQAIDPRGKRRRS